MYGTRRTWYMDPRLCSAEGETGLIAVLQLFPMKNGRYANKDRSEEALWKSVDTNMIRK